MVTLVQSGKRNSLWIDIVLQKTWIWFILNQLVEQVVRLSLWNISVGLVLVVFCPFLNCVFGFFFLQRTQVEYLLFLRSLYCIIYWWLLWFKKLLLVLCLLRLGLNLGLFKSWGLEHEAASGLLETKRAVDWVAVYFVQVNFQLIESIFPRLALRVKCPHAPFHRFLVYLITVEFLSWLDKL